jgi:hypothetical protein
MTRDVRALDARYRVPGEPTIGSSANAVDTSAEFLILFLNRTAMVLCDEILPGFLLPWLWYPDTCSLEENSNDDAG